MDATDYINSEVNGGFEFAVFRGGNSYSGGMEDTGDRVIVDVTEAASQAADNVEGSSQDVSFRGLLNPSYDDSGGLTDVVKVNDELRLVGNKEIRYVVQTKQGQPNDIDPELWNLGLDRANST